MFKRSVQLACCLALLLMLGWREKPPRFRVVGYLLQGKDVRGRAATLDLDRITDLNIAFLNPDSTGSFTVSDSLRKAVEFVHSKGVAIFFSIGGGSAPEYLKALLKEGRQEKLVEDLTQLTRQYGFDGVDVDLEETFITDDYGSFVHRLGKMLHAQGKLMTAAVATAYGPHYPDKALHEFDFISIMSYDKTGPWTPSKPGPHSPYSMAVDDLVYWNKTRKIASDKLNLGVPFYGYGFGVNAPESMSYQGVITQYPDAWNVDQLTVPGGGIVYYNGAATIKAKTALALQKKAGGMMIWELTQDAQGPSSLLRAMDSVIRVGK